VEIEVVKRAACNSRGYADRYRCGSRGAPTVLSKHIFAEIDTEIMAVLAEWKNNDGTNNDATKSTDA
jgi:hypothetical protein